jgi:hypothetical protein
MAEQIEAELDQLIGQLKVEVEVEVELDWLKKSLGCWNRR